MESIEDFYRDGGVFCQESFWAGDDEYYAKYRRHLMTSRPRLVLDVGCGGGQVVNGLAEGGFCAVGTDVSPTPLETAQRGGGWFVLQPFTALPFATASFDVVGSHTVIEHVLRPELFLDELVRVLKANGRLVLACPNFLSITNSYHWHTAGVVRKLSNLVVTFSKLYRARFASHLMRFEFMEPRLGLWEFKPDDDAVCVTNPIDVLFQLHRRDIDILYWSSVLQASRRVYVDWVRDLPVLKLFFGGVFVVGRKQ